MNTSTGKSIRMLVFAAILIALDIVFTRLMSIDVLLYRSTRLSPAFLPQALSGAYLGPIFSSMALVVADLLGMLLNPSSGAYFWGYTLTAAVRGLLFGLILHRSGKRRGGGVVLWNVAFAFLATSVICDLGLNTLWTLMLNSELNLTYSAFWLQVWMKLPVRAIIFVVQTSVYFTVASELKKTKLEI